MAYSFVPHNHQDRLVAVSRRFQTAIFQGSPLCSIRKGGPFCSY